MQKMMVAVGDDPRCEVFVEIGHAEEWAANRSDTHTVHRVLISDAPGTEHVFVVTEDAVAPKVFLDRARATTWLERFGADGKDLHERPLRTQAVLLQLDSSDPSGRPQRHVEVASPVVHVAVYDSHEVPEVYLDSETAQARAVELGAGWSTAHEYVKTRALARKNFGDLVQLAREEGWYREGPRPDPISESEFDETYRWVTVVHSGRVVFVYEDESDAVANDFLSRLSPSAPAGYTLHTLAVEPAVLSDDGSSEGAAPDIAKEQRAESMNSDDVFAFLQRLPALVEGMEDFEVRLPPSPDHGGTATFRYGPAVVWLHIRPSAELMVCAGVARDVRITDELIRDVNACNARTLVVGRLFAREYEGEGAGRGAVLLQEIIECQYLDNGFSRNLLVQTIARIGGMAATISPAFVAHDGTPWPPEAWLHISILA